MIALADRLGRIAEPQTIRMAKLSRELRAQGIDITDLSLGEPDFRTPDHIIEAANQAMQEGYTKYPPVAGFPELREAVCLKFKRDNQLIFDPAQIVVSTGAKQALANIILSLINPGDEAIIPTPYWVSYSALVSLGEGVPVYVEGKLENDFKITPEQLEAAITTKTKLFIFSSPCNPTGSVYSKAELAALATVFEKHPQVFIISDEIYEYINYIGAHESIAQFESLRDRIAVVNGFSKGFAMTGWRLGYAAMPLYLAQACEKFQAQFTSGANSIAQRAAITALTGDLSITRKMVEAFKERRDYVLARLQAMPGISINAPEGAFYMFPDVSSFFGKKYDDGSIENDEDVSMYLLHKGHLTTVNGGAFGNDQCIRLSIAASMEKLKEGMDKMEKALSQLH